MKSSPSLAHDDGDISEEEAVVWEFQFGTREKLEKGHYNIVFAHLEFIISSEDARKLMQSKRYHENVCATVWLLTKPVVFWNGKLDGDSHFKTLIKIR